MLSLEKETLCLCISMFTSLYTDPTPNPSPWRGGERLREALSMKLRMTHAEDKTQPTPPSLQGESRREALTMKLRMTHAEDKMQPALPSPPRGGAGGGVCNHKKRFCSLMRKNVGDNSLYQHRDTEVQRGHRFHEAFNKRKRVALMEQPSFLVAGAGIEPATS